MKALVMSLLLTSVASAAFAQDQKPFAPPWPEDQTGEERAAYLSARAAAGENPKFEPICVYDRQRKCWFDAHYKAWVIMGEKIDACNRTDDPPTCLRSIAWRQPLNQDERFKPKLEVRK